MFTSTGLTLVQVNRIYFGKDGDRVVILLGGSDKKRQAAAIAKAKLALAAYKQLKLKNKTAD